MNYQVLITRFEMQTSDPREVSLQTWNPSQALRHYKARRGKVWFLDICGWIIRKGGLSGQDKITD
jgi:hypothetical protein